MACKQDKQEVTKVNYSAKDRWRRSAQSYGVAALHIFIEMTEFINFRHLI
jgi:hypothetical protein